MWVSEFSFFHLSEYHMYTLISLICMYYMVYFQFNICLDKVLLYADCHGRFYLPGAYVSQ
jgi:hypothetical protein